MVSSILWSNYSNVMMVKITLMKVVRIVLMMKTWVVYMNIVI